MFSSDLVWMRWQADKKLSVLLPPGVRRLPSRHRKPPLPPPLPPPAGPGPATAPPLLLPLLVVAWAAAVELELAPPAAAGTAAEAAAAGSEFVRGAPWTGGEAKGEVIRSRPSSVSKGCGGPCGVQQQRSVRRVAVQWAEQGKTCCMPHQVHFGVF